MAAPKWLGACARPAAASLGAARARMQTVSGRPRAASARSRVTAVLVTLCVWPVPASGQVDRQQCALVPPDMDFQLYPGQEYFLLGQSTQVRHHVPTAAAALSSRTKAAAQER